MNKKHTIAVKQMQYFEIEIDKEDLPLTEEVFFSKYYDLGNADLNTEIAWMEFEIQEEK